MRIVFVYSKFMPFLIIELLSDPALQLIGQLQQEALKLAYAYKSDPTLMFGPNKDYTSWNPMQVIDTLNDVNRCMNHAQCRMWPAGDSPILGPANNLNIYNSSPLVSRLPLPHGGHLYPPSASGVNAPLSNCPIYKLSHMHPGLVSSFGSPLGSGTGAHSSVLTNTDYPDTLRSLNTLTTEFAVDEQASRNTHPPPPSHALPGASPPSNLVPPFHHHYHHHHHHHHCYDVYDPQGPAKNEQTFVHLPSESDCSGVFSPPTPLTSTRLLGGLHENEQFGTGDSRSTSSECPVEVTHVV